MKSRVSKAVAKYFKTTTLHGLKYLVSRHHADRVCWALCCIASACCAGVLCAVLWERFVTLPGLVTTQDPRIDEARYGVPTVAVCQRLEDITGHFLNRVANNGVRGVNKTRLLAAFVNVLEGKETEAGHVQIIEDLIAASGLTLLEVFWNFSPSCEILVRKCRLQNVIVPCELLFTKQVTAGGICCNTYFTSFSYENLPVYLRSDVDILLELVLNCRSQPEFRGCVFFTEYGKFARDEELSPKQIELAPGTVYYTEMLYTEETDTNGNEVIEDTCVSDNQYSQLLCWLMCVETKCGCYNSLLIRYRLNNYPRENLPPCRLHQYRCIKTIRSRGIRSKASCNCLPLCRKLIRRMILQSAPLITGQHIIDPLTSFLKPSTLPSDSSELSASQSVVLRMVINDQDSLVLNLVPTESWLTLLSSMGGVFSMFLGVGLFSILEILFFLFVKLPVAIRRKTQRYFHN